MGVISSFFSPVLRFIDLICNEAVYNSYLYQERKDSPGSEWIISGDAKKPRTKALILLVRPAQPAGFKDLLLYTSTVAFIFHRVVVLPES